MVVLRAANQNLLIAGGNHTLIPSMNHRRYIGCTVYWVVLFIHTGDIRNVPGTAAAVPYGFADGWNH